MIARPLSAPRLPVPTVGGRAGRIAVLGRRKAGVRRRYSMLVGVFMWIAAVTFVVMGYLTLLVNVSHLYYEFAQANNKRLELQDMTMRLDDKIARLRSRDRLALVAGQLGMRDPAAYAVVRLPREPIAAVERGSRLAFLSAITGWIR
jgi:hypothetical protein